MKKIFSKITFFIKNKIYTEHSESNDVWIVVTSDFLNNPNRICLKIN